MQYVLIIDSELLLGAAIQSYLAGAADLAVIGFSTPLQEKLCQELRQTISRFQPDSDVVVVIDEDYYLTSPIRVPLLLLEFPNLRIVVVSANHDLVRIYQKHEVQLSALTQLATIIRNGHLRNEK